MGAHEQTGWQRLAGLLAMAAAMAVLGSPALVLGHPYPEPLNNSGSGSSTLVHWFADWAENTNTPPTDFIATPFANNSNVASVKAQMVLSANLPRPLGTKIRTPLSASAASSLFSSSYGSGNKAISYIFCDFESAGSLVGTTANITNVSQVVSQKNSSSWTGRAYVGEFALTPLTGVGFGAGQDPTRRGALMYTKTQYDASKVNMANTDLYPGSANYRNKSSGDWNNANIRTGLFIAPIGRMTAVQNQLNSSYNGLSNSVNNGDQGAAPQYHKQIPWVARFNNWGNIKLDTDNNGSNGYKFVPGAALPSAGLSASQTSNQMMGRGDFSAQILHYRMRGAYSVNLFESGVVGYTHAQEQQDVRDGWYGASDSHVAHINQIFQQTDRKAATMTLNPVVDGTSNTSGIRSEATGAIWSGEYSKSLKKLDILVSNLDTVNHKVWFGDVDAYKVFTFKNSSGNSWDDGSKTASSRTALIEAGMHRLLQFDLVSTKVFNSASCSGSYSTKSIWLLNHNYQVFNSNNRNDVGIPEPTTGGVLAAAGSMALVCRRHRRKQDAA